MNSPSILVIYMGTDADLGVVPGSVQVGDCTWEVTRFQVVWRAEEDALRAVVEPLGGNRVQLLATPLHDYGVCLKLAFRYAIEQAYTVVIVAGRGDPSIPAELIERLPRLADGELGAAWWSGGGGLTRWLRVMAPGQPQWSEWAWGACSVRSLATLPFALNGRSAIFLTELAVQYALSDFVTETILVPDARVPSAGPRTPRNVWRQAMALLRYRFHTLGLLYQLNYDVKRQQTNYTPKFGYASSHEYALACVPAGSTVTDLGAGEQAYLVEPLKQKGCRVFAADMRPIEHPDVEEAFCLNLNTDPLPGCVADSDVILLLDIIEHLNDPESLLIDLRGHVTYDRTRVILTTPNIAFFITRLMLLIGQFNYGKSGILDRTHTRLFTYRSLRRTLRQCGYVIEKEQGVPAPFVKALGPSVLTRVLTWSNLVLIRLSRSLFAYQIFVQLRADPTLDTLRRSHPRE